MNINIKNLDVRKDDRGWLAEVIRSDDVRSSNFGQLLVTTAKPGQTKGNHYHKRKTEWYCVVKGDGLLALKDNKTGEEKEILVGEKNMSLIEIPPDHTHSIKNIGRDDLYLIAYTNEVFNKLDPDTYNK